MQPPGQRFRYKQPSLTSGLTQPMPYLPIGLALKQSVTVDALLDTGSPVSVIPHTLGLQLGGNWSSALPIGALGGALAQSQTRSFFADLTAGPYPSVWMGFAWADTDNVPIILGHVNFFQMFDVCFYGSRSEFEIRPKI